MSNRYSTEGVCDLHTATLSEGESESAKERDKVTVRKRQSE